MAIRKTINFLPEVFRSDTNKKFLNATLDQLISEPSLTRLNGFVGRKFSTAFGVSSNYITEPTTDRQNYQFEPSVVTETNESISLYVGYQDLVNRISYYGGTNNNHDRLFNSEYYSYDPHLDLDKLSNYSQYYWLPNGPESVTISAGVSGEDQTYAVTHSFDGYITDLTGTTYNPEITLVRGATYQFDVNQTSQFWIQTEPGLSGVKEHSPTVTTRNIFGVTDNGQSSGVITFTVPAKDEQDHYLKNPLLDFINFATSETFSSLDNRIWSPAAEAGDPRSAQMLDDIDGSTKFPDQAYIVFVTSELADGHWTTDLGNIVDEEKRRGLWKINVVVNLETYNGTTYRTPRIRFSYVRDIDVGTRVRSIDGTVNAGNEFFKNSLGIFEAARPLTASLSTLYYQDSVDATYFGKINIVDAPGQAINVDADIVGKIAYTSPQGVVFTNGLKIQFDSTVNPIGYRDKIYIVEGVGSKIKLVDFTLLEPIESKLPDSAVTYDSVKYDSGPWDEVIRGTGYPEYIVMSRACDDLNAWSRINRWFHIDTLRKIAEYNNSDLSVSLTRRAQRPIIEFKPNLQLFNHGRKLLKIIDRYDDKTKPAVGDPVPITDGFALLNNRSPSDLGVAELEIKDGQITVFPNDVDPIVRSKIYQISFSNQRNTTVFDGNGIGVINITAGKKEITNAAFPSEIPKTAFNQQLEPGSVIYTPLGQFIGKVKRVINSGLIILEEPALFTYNRINFKFNRPRIVLTQVAIATSFDSVVVRNNKKSYWYNGTNWLESQLKSETNQDPLFDIVNEQGISFENKTVYPGSEFAGCKILGYTRTSGINDSILGFPIKYNGTRAAVSDIDFTNYFDTDTFSYKPALVVTKSISSGYIRKNLTSSTYEKLNVWPKVEEPTKQYQHITGKFDGLTNYFEIDIDPAPELNQPNIKVYINNKIIDNSLFEIRTVGVRKAVYIGKTLTIGDVIDIFIYSTQTSKLGYYRVPTNLEFNPQNTTVNSFTLGQIQNHWAHALDNTKNVVGQGIGENNSKDLVKFGAGTLVQHSAPLIFGSLFLNGPDVNFINSLDYARRDYQRFKNKFLELCISMTELDPADPGAGVEMILSNINAVKNPAFPWYYSDMLPWGKTFVSEQFKVVNATTRTYQIADIFDQFGLDIYPGRETSKAISIYLNKKLLILGKDYNINYGSPSVILSSSLTINLGDIITVKCYPDTDGSYIPETPTKLGLYPKFTPTRYVDNTYKDSVEVIQGHDGSLTPVFNDLRDAYLLELETRIFNNLKINYNKNLFDIYSVIPGKFRKTEYTITEYNKTLGADFLKWVGTNQLNFAENPYYVANDKFSWNYNQTQDTIDDESLPGYWRGIYKYFYDTDRPHTHPWEMLGFADKPIWWEATYGVAPYTSSNATLWNDLELGRNANNNTIDSRFKRPGLKNIIPVDQDGNLLAPTDARLVKGYGGAKFSQTFVIGDQGPVETAWRRSSDYPFAIQRAMAVMKPAKYFGLLFDTINYSKNTQPESYVLKGDNRRPSGPRIKLNGETVNGEVTRTLGYINWIHGYLTNLGIDPIEKIRGLLNNTNVKLSYKVAGYTDKRYINCLIEQISPTSTSTSSMIPDENYVVHLNEGVPSSSATYSAVIIEKTSSGYSLNGYNAKSPYFTIIPSEFNGPYYTISSLDRTAVIFEGFKSQLISIPYGFEFKNAQQVVDFLMGYQRYLISQGFMFNQFDSDLGTTSDWVLSAKEFLTWTQQGWKDGNIIILSPIKNTLRFFNENYVVGKITNQPGRSKILGPNFNIVPLNEVSVYRETNLTNLTLVSGQTIALAELELVQIEHVLIYDNVTVFNDVIYKPELGTRQYRIKLIGNKTSDWQGNPEPPGFLYTTGKIDSWRASTDYRKGDIVRYKNKNYSAIKDIAGTQTFEFENWNLVDTVLEPGILSNFATNAQKFVDFYDVDSVSVDENFNRFGTGLIGYRNRSYLEDLGMDQISQVKFYQGFIKEKGTGNSLNALFDGQFDGVKSTVDFYEEWGIRVGEYGSTSLNQSIDLILQEDKFRSNPAAFKLLNNGDESTDSIVTIRPNQLLHRPLTYSSPVFLNRSIGERLETDIKTAGYVNYFDVDGAVFDITKYALYSSNLLNLLSDGYLLWVAKDFDEDWQVYKARKTKNILTLMEYALDNKIKLTFAYDHGLQIGDIFVVRNFDTTFNGFYRVINTEESNSIIAFIDLSLVPSISTVRGGIQGTGELFLFERCRYVDLNQRDRAYSKFRRNKGDLVWVDANDEGRWAVYSYDQGSGGNYNGSHSTWGIKNGTINFQGSGLPYHSHGTDDYVVEDKQFNRYWPLYGGTDTPAAVKTDATGITGFWLNGVPITAPSKPNFAPGDYLLFTGYDYNLGFSDFNALKIDSAGGLTLDGIYSYNKFLFPEAWRSGIGRDDTKEVAEMDEIPYLSSTLFHPDGHSKIIGFAMDGYPIYGPKGYAYGTDPNSIVVCMRSSYRLKDPGYRNVECCNIVKYPMGMFIQDYEYVEGSGDLDRHNGRYCVTPDYPNGTYAYFVTLDDDCDKPYYPYVIGPTYYGVISDVVNNIVPGPGYEPITYILAGSVSWKMIRDEEPKVDVRSFNKFYLYNNTDKQILERLDYYDPVKGKILGTVQADIDYITSYDPARYNQGTATDLSIDSTYHWGEKQLGTIWWDIDNLRYIEYEQGSLEYRAKYWGDRFPGSAVEVYEWVMAEVLPSKYVSAKLEGTPKFADDSAYVTLNYVDPATGLLKTRYCYWVRGRTVKQLESKTHNPYTIEAIIRDPKGQDIPFVGVLKDNSVMLYNSGRFLSGSTTALHIDYKLKINENSIHTEFELFQEGNPDSILSPRIENKLIDSLVGVDKNGKILPDPSLLPGDRLGIENKPRQSMIQNRLVAVQNIVGYLNSILIQHPVANRIVYKQRPISSSFFAAMPFPDSSQYDWSADTYEQLEFAPEITADSLIAGRQYVIKNVGTSNFILAGAASNNVGATFTATGPVTGTGVVYPRRILVNADVNFNNHWSLYGKNADGSIFLVSVQSYDTTDFWTTVDWYASGFDAKSTITYIVSKSSDIHTLTLAEGDIVKVQNNGGNQFELHQYVNGRLSLVGLQNGTIQLSTTLYEEKGFDFYSFDFDPFDPGSSVELRYIIQGLKEDVFVRDLSEYYNKFLFYVIDYILSEQIYVDWIFKTSFVSVLHKFEGLVQSTSYIKSQHDLYKQYIEEVKPYRTKIREYNLNYSTVDEMSQAAVSDFDLPAYYDAELETFRSPNGYLTKDQNLLSTRPEYRDWNDNHTYELRSIEIAKPGSDYLTAPDVSIVSTDTTSTGATAVAAINSTNGKINKITITDPGSGYTLTPIVGVNGTGYSPMSKYEVFGRDSAVLSPRLFNQKIRKIKTVLRFDRVTYESDIQDWQPGVDYDSGVVISYQGKGYKNNSAFVIPASTYFDVSQWKPIRSDMFDNAADRIMAFYQPTGSMPPKVLNQLITGLDRPQGNVVVTENVDTFISGGTFNGTTIAPNLVIIGEKYIIASVGDTDFEAMGASESRTGVIFTATAVGSGTGKLVIAIDTSAFSNVDGISTGEITVNGGAFVSEIFSHSPPELLPGITYDALSIKSINQSNVGFRIFVDMNENRTATVVNLNTTTTLDQDLIITDTEIVVANGNDLSAPSSPNDPGVIYINGERIEYTLREGNVLKNLRRSAGGTGAPLVHPAGSIVESGDTPATLPVPTI